MKCRDFKRLINEQLDARGAASPDAERALESHGSACPACRVEALRYQTLRQAIASWGPPPAPPADFVDRFLEHWEHAGSAAAETVPFPTRKLWPATLALAAAAALLLAVLLGVRSGLLVRPARPGPTPPQLARAIDPDELSTALAEATSATWDLARTTSEPAARVGLEFLDTSELARSSAALSLPGAVEPAPASEVLRDVGERVNDGVRPLSGTARSAFGFLFGPALAPPEAPPPPSRGA